jgi:hypothetical protein
MSYEDLDRINHLLDGSTHIDLSELLSDGRIGLAVVRELARRHDIRVRLQSNIFGGIAAAVVIPPQLLSEPERETPAPSRHRAGQPHQSALPKRRQDPAALESAEESATGRPSPAPRNQEPLAARSNPALNPVAARSNPAMSPVAAQGWPTPSPTPRQQEPVPSPMSAPARETRPSTSVSSPSPAEQSGPIQVPAPLPIPTASVTSPNRPPQTSRHRAEVPDDQLPVLPVRSPGRSYDDLRAGGNGGITGEMTTEQGEGPPPLPQRRGSHLREELLEPPAVTKPVPGHNTSLMKTFQAGRENWLAEQNREENTSRGDSWPTT